MPIAGQWFASDFPGAGYAVRTTASADYLGIFAVTPGALEYRGIVSSPAAGAGKIKFDPAVSTLSFPLQMGKKWEVTTVSGDTPVPLNFAYSYEVDAEGEMKTSSSLNAFKVMRVSLLLKKTPAFSLVSYYTRSYVYVAESLRLYAAPNGLAYTASKSRTHSIASSRATPARTSRSVQVSSSFRVKTSTSRSSCDTST